MAKGSGQILIVLLCVAFLLTVTSASDSCASDEFKCRDGDCIPEDWQCDRAEDCMQGEDELNCKPECGKHMFECDNGECIDPRLVCDGRNDCGDMSDEYADYECGNHTLSANCTKEQFVCKNPKACIDKHEVCNGRLDCRDGSDESTCHKTCKSDEFLCANETHTPPYCIENIHLCDDIEDCEDGSDESQCTSKNGVYGCTDNPHDFICTDYSDCITAKKVCDGHRDCKDGSDEDFECSKTCNRKCYGCKPSEEGTKCVCDVGFKLTNNSNNPCTDIDECHGDKIVCSQRCRNTHGSYRCFCLDGYSLNSDDKTTCKALDEPLLVLATRDEIRTLSFHKRNYIVRRTDLDNALAIAIDNKENRLFWSEMAETGSPGVYYVDLSNPQFPKLTVINYGLVRPSALGYDYLRKILYILDSGMPAIVACSVHKRCATVFDKDNLKHPTAMVLHAQNGTVYWVNNEAGSSVIMSGSMAGQKASPFVKAQIRKVSSLCLDSITNRLFWYDSFYRRVESIRLDGKGRQIILTSESIVSSTLEVFEDTIVWLSKNSHKLMGANKFTGFDKRELKQHVPDVVAVSIAHPTLAPELSDFHDCDYNQCSFLCLSGFGDVGVCVCGDGYTLDHNEECIANRDEHSEVFLIASARNKIVTLPVSGNPTMRYHESNKMRNVYMVAYLALSQEIVYSTSMASGKKAIYKMPMDKSSAELIVDDLQSVQSLAVDESASVIYWVDSVKGTIEVASLDGKYTRPLPIPSSKPQALAIDPANGALFYSDLSTPVSIKKCDQNGKNCINLATGGMQRPNCLLVFGGQLYWSDFDTGDIFSISFTGHNKTKIAVAGGQPVSIAISNKTVFWTELNWEIETSSNIHYRHLNTHKRVGPESSIDTKAGMTLSGLALGRPHKSVSTECSKNNGGCDHICIPTRGGVSCICHFRYELQDGRKCQKAAINCTGFHCDDGTCIDANKRCNYDRDCPDRSDEQDCEAYKQDPCSSDEFQCLSGGCQPSGYVCDGDEDCSDGSDENNKDCPDGQKPCESHQHKCDDGECVWADICDGFNDCNDGSDEKNCSAKTCSSHQFLCDSEHCFSNEWKCDGDIDCNDESDEKDCEDKCNAGQHKCEDGSCILIDDFCDGINNCDSGEDETNCSKKTDCYFECYDGSCLTESAVCNDIPNCRFHEDESECKRCPEFQCLSEECFSAKQRCNMIVDCEDGIDEKDCPPPPTEPPFPKCDKGFLCSNGECLDQAKVCDEKPDCFDGTDEYGCKITCKNYPCRQHCFETVSGPKCKCDKGYNLVNHFRCDDIDECSEPMNGCNQRCTNSKGSYHCSCMDGYVKGKDGVCKAEGPRPVMFIGTTTGIKKLSANGRSETMEVSMHTMAIHMDLNVRNKQFVWVQYEGNDSSRMALYIAEHGSPKPKLLSNNLRDVKGLAVDWFTGNIYVSQKYKTISVYDLQGRHMTVNSGRYEPTSIALLPSRGYMFWIATEDTGHGCRVVKAWMSGDNQTQLVNAIGQHIHSLTIDYATERLYWLNSLGIESSNLEGNRFKAVPVLTSRIYSMDIFEGIAYLYDQSSGKIRTVATYKYNRPVFEHHHTYLKVSRAGPIKISHELKQPMDGKRNPCANMGCPYMCVLSQHSARCVCPDGSIMQNGHCIEMTDTSTSTFTTKTSTVATASLVTTKLSSTEIPSSTLVSKVCTLQCENGGSCILVDVETHICSCKPGYMGTRCQHSTNDERNKNEKDKEEESLLWIIGVVVGVLLLVAVGISVGFYIRYRRNNATFMSTIKYLHKKTGKGKENDKTELVPEISFGNPGFQEEIDEEAEQYQDWWKKLLSRSRRSIDSAFMGSRPSSESSGDVEKPDEILTACALGASPPEKIKAKVNLL